MAVEFYSPLSHQTDFTKLEPLACKGRNPTKEGML